MKVKFLPQEKKKTKVYNTHFFKRRPSFSRKKKSVFSFSSFTLSYVWSQIFKFIVVKQYHVNHKWLDPMFKPFSRKYFYNMVAQALASIVFIPCVGRIFFFFHLDFKSIHGVYIFSFSEFYYIEKTTAINPWHGYHSL